MTASPGADPLGAERLEVDVAVVGAGPVGCALALLLADRGRSVALVERYPTPYPLPRAVHFDDETARILAAVGLGPLLPGLSEPADVYEWQNGEGVPLLRFGIDGPGPSGWPTANFFNQPDLEGELHARVDAHPRIAVRRGHQAIGLDALEPSGTTRPLAEDDAADPGVRVRLTTEPTVDPTSGDRAGGIAGIAADAPADPGLVAGGLVVDASFVVGCDGANSFVRSVLDPEIEDHGFFFDWLIVDVALHEPRPFTPSNLQVCDPARPTTVISGGPGRRRWEFMCLPGEDLHSLGEEARAWELLTAWDVTPDNATLVRHAGYRFQARWARSWRRGRVFLAGDAAHQTPPFAGQGMCAGLRDAANLAWKLDLALDLALDPAIDVPAPGPDLASSGLDLATGESGRDAVDAVLASYESERLPHAARVIGLAIELGKVICVPDPDEAAARDAAMAPAVADGSMTPSPGMGGIGPGLVAAETEAAGSLFVQGRVAAALSGTEPAAAGRFDEIIGVGWALIGTPTGLAGVEAAAVDQLRAHGGSVVVVRPPEAAPDVDRDRVERLAGCTVVDDVDGTYHSWLERHGVEVVLQRPDFYVYGTARTPADVDALLTQWRRALAR